MPQTTPSAIGTAVRTLRVEADLTLADVTAIAGVSQAYLSRVENGHTTPSDKWITIVATAIGEHIAENRGSAA